MSKPATRGTFAKVSSFCIHYGYVGCTWNGEDLTCYKWRANGSVDENYLEPFEPQELKPSMQQSTWMGMEAHLKDVTPFSWGFAKGELPPPRSLESGGDW